MFHAGRAMASSFIRGRGYRKCRHCPIWPVVIHWTLCCGRESSDDRFHLMREISVLFLVTQFNFLPAKIDIVTPQTLEPGDDCGSIVFIQYLTKARHHSAKLRTAVNDGVVENLKRMVPGVCRSV